MIKTGIHRNRAQRAIAEKRLKQTLQRMGPAFLKPGQRFFDIRFKYSKTLKGTATWDSKHQRVVFIRRSSLLDKS